MVSHGKNYKANSFYMYALPGFIIILQDDVERYYDAICCLEKMLSDTKCQVRNLRRTAACSVPTQKKAVMLVAILSKT